MKSIGYVYIIKKTFLLHALVNILIFQVLHPLKSETNFPIGEKKSLDLNSQRWLLPMHILEGILFACGCNQKICLGETMLAESDNQILSELALAFTEGFDSMALQRSPHLLILQPEFYAKKLKFLVAAWTMVWLKQQTPIVQALALELAPFDGEERLTRYISMEVVDISYLESESACNGCIPLLNIARSWVNQYTQHCLSKRNRIEYGLIQESDTEAWKLELKQDVVLATSRRLLAVPFIGKDVPSRVSEFSSPDVCIGLTFLAYKYEGMRASDISDLLCSMKRLYASEAGPIQSRNSWMEFAQFLDEEYKMENENCSVLPLDLIQPSDPEQLKAAVIVLRKSSRVIFKHCQASYAATMQFHQRKLQASGIDVGGTILFRNVLGFSGTPSKLLPVSLGECKFEAGCEARVVKILTSLDHVIPLYPSKKCQKWKFLFQDETEWTVESILKGIARAEPPYHALIDAGAIITGFRNEEVARYLLLNGLTKFKACIYLDDSGAKMAVVRSGAELSPLPVPIEQCGVHISARFCFFDQIHTTGTDLKMPIDAKAVATIGKGMTLRDHAQSCWRMRGLEHGQTVDILLVTEIYKLINSIQPNHEPDQSEVLHNVLIWLIKNGLHSEKLQRIQFSARKVMNCWRTSALDELLGSSALAAEGQVDPEKPLVTTRFQGPVSIIDPFNLKNAKSNLECMYQSIKKIETKSGKSRYSSKVLNKQIMKESVISALFELPSTTKVRSWIGSRHFLYNAVDSLNYWIDRSDSQSEEEALSTSVSRISYMFSDPKSKDLLLSLIQGKCRADPVTVSPHEEKLQISRNSNLSTCLDVFIERLDHDIPATTDKKESVLSLLTKLRTNYDALLNGTGKAQIDRMFEELKSLTTTGSDSSQSLDR
jgi:hypothetical protein